MVNNVKGEDWNDLKLTLVVGAPPLQIASGSGGGGPSGGSMELVIKQTAGADFFIRCDPRDTVESVICKVSE